LAKADATRLRAQGLGVVAGVPDIIAVRSGQMYCLELKAPGGKLTDNQRATHSAMITAGAQVATADNLDDALALLEGWGLCRTAQRAPRDVAAARHLIWKRAARLASPDLQTSPPCRDGP
jgi:hypothetical protein